MAIPENLSEQEMMQLIDTLRLDEDQHNSTKKETRKQAECTKWRDERFFPIYCLYVSSNFKTAAKS